MKKLSLTIIAFAALSSAAYASYEKRDWINCMEQYCDTVKTPFDSSIKTVVSPFAVDENALGLSNFERLMKISKENDQGRH